MGIAVYNREEEPLNITEQKVVAGCKGTGREKTGWEAIKQIFLHVVKD